MASGNLLGSDFNLSADVSPDLALEAQRVNRKQRIADLLIKQGLGGVQNEQHGRFYVAPSPWQHLAKLAEVGVGAHMTSSGDEELKGLAGQQKKMIADALARYQTQTAPTPAQPGASPVPTIGAAPGALAGTQIPDVSENLTARPAPDPPQDIKAGFVPAPTSQTQPVMSAAGPATPTQPKSPAELQAANMGLIQTGSPTLTRVANTMIEHQQRQAEQAKLFAQQTELERQKETWAREREGLPKRTGPVAIGPGHQLVDPETGRVIAAGPATDKPPPHVNTETGIFERGPDGKMVPLKDDKGNILKPPSTRPSVTTIIGKDGTPVQVDAKTGRVIGDSWHGSSAEVAYKTQAANEKAFQSGKEAGFVRSNNVAHDHLDSWEKAAHALDNGDSQTFNAIANKIGKQFGKPAPTNLEAMAQIVGPEVVKAIVAGGGGVEERQQMAKTLGVNLSPGQEKGTPEALRVLLMGQVQGLKRQYLSGPGATEENFNKKLSPNLLRRISAYDAGNAPSTGATPPPSSGPTATGPNGQKLTLQGGQWVPVP